MKCRANLKFTADKISLRLEGGFLGYLENLAKTIAEKIHWVRSDSIVILQTGFEEKADSYFFVDVLITLSEKQQQRLERANRKLLEIVKLFLENHFEISIVQELKNGNS